MSKWKHEVNITEIGKLKEKIEWGMAWDLKFYIGLVNVRNSY